MAASFPSSDREFDQGFPEICKGHCLALYERSFASKVFFFQSSRKFFFESCYS